MLKKTNKLDKEKERVEEAAIHSSVNWKKKKKEQKKQQFIAERKRQNDIENKAYCLLVWTKTNSNFKIL